MWFSAQRYAAAVGSAFPDPTGAAPCPLCQQDLDDAATQRLQRFEEFVTSDLRQQSIELDISDRRDPRRTPRYRRHTRCRRGRAARAARSGRHGRRRCPHRGLAARLAAARTAAAGESVTAADRAVDVAPLGAHALAQDAIAERHAACGTRSAASVLRQREELRPAQPRRSHRTIMDRPGLSRIPDRWPGRSESSPHQQQAARVAAGRDHRTAAQGRRGRGSGATPGRQHRRDHWAGQQGRTAIHLTLKAPGRAEITSVLSDGEQRALALAFFLAEVAVSDERSAIVLDDPVSSLDHDRRSYVAERLAEESRRGR